MLLFNKCAIQLILLCDFEVCFSERLRFSFLITAYCLMFNDNQITVKENPILKLSDPYTAIRTLEHYGLNCSCLGMRILFLIKENTVRNHHLLKCLQQSKITDFLQQGAFYLCVSVNVYRTFIPYQNLFISKYFNYSVVTSLTKVIFINILQLWITEGQKKIVLG